MSSNDSRETSLNGTTSGDNSVLANSELAVSVRNLSKSYVIAHQASTHVASGASRGNLATRFRRNEKETFWALRDVSFDIRRGDVVGIIGRNGAGKSTLLKILSQITEPTTGEIDIYGRVGSLLEVGTGFHPELTGRENIFLNGAILGMRRREIEQQFDAIVEFAEVEQFLDTPVKRYSSGMYVRLAFAVAAHLTPEIMIVDEVLAVGDAAFQKKCMGKMSDVARAGRTVLFVSHSIGAVSNLCTSCIVMKNGCVAFQGPTEDAIRFYLEGAARSEGALKAVEDFRPPGMKPLITGGRVLNPLGQEASFFPLGADITFEMSFVAPPDDPIRQPVMGVVINHPVAGIVANVNTRMTDFVVGGGPYTQGTMSGTIKRMPFVQGRYTADLWMADGDADLDCVQGFLQFDIEATDIYRTGKTPFSNSGVAFLDPTWEFSASARTVDAPLPDGAALQSSDAFSSSSAK